MRGKCQEAAYNLGRAFHQVGKHIYLPYFQGHAEASRPFLFYYTHLEASSPSVLSYACGSKIDNVASRE